MTRCYQVGRVPGSVRDANGIAPNAVNPGLSRFSGLPAQPSLMAYIQRVGQMAGTRRDSAGFGVQATYPVPPHLPRPRYSTLIGVLTAIVIAVLVLR